MAERDPDAEAWIFISLGLLSTIDRRLGNLVGDEFDDIVASRRAWMTGPRAKRKPPAAAPGAFGFCAFWRGDGPKALALRPSHNLRAFRRRLWRAPCIP